MRLRSLLPVVAASLALAGPGVALDVSHAQGREAQAPPRLEAAQAPAVARPTPARAATSWTEISNVSVTDQAMISLVRGTDGVLNGAFTRENGGLQELWQTRVQADGIFLGNAAVLTGMDSMSRFPIYTKTSTGLRVLVGLQAAGGVGDPFTDAGVYAAETDATVSSAWSYVTTPVLGTGAAIVNQGLGAVTLADDTPVAAASSGTETWYSAGFGGATSTFAMLNCCTYFANVVTDGTNAAVAWQANGAAANTTGTFARQIYPGLGSTTYKAPRSSTDTGSGHAASMNDQPTAAVVRNDGGTYLAYPIGYPARTAVGLWKAGDAKATLLPSSKNAQRVALATTPSGRLWVAWSTPTGSIKLVRSSATGLKLGGVQTIKKPGSATGVHQIALEASRNAVAVVINGGDRFFYTSVKPLPNLTASPTTLTKGKATTVRFTVKDAGVALKGAKVRAKGETCTTNAKGLCSIRFPALRKGSVTATATKGSTYAAATLTLRVR